MCPVLALSNLLILPSLYTPPSGVQINPYPTPTSLPLLGMYKGQNIKSFEFEENILEEGRKKNELRKMLSAKLKAAVDMGIVRCDVPFIQSLIRRANIARGSVLQLDVRYPPCFFYF